MVSAGTTQQPVAAVPAGGLGGQALIRAGTTGSAQWAAPPGGIPTWLPVSGQWYGSQVTAGAVGSQTTWGPGSYYTPMYVPQLTTVAALGVYAGANTAAGSVSASVFTTNPATGAPAIRLAQVSISYPQSTAGFVSTALPSPITIGPGWYHLHIGASASNTAVYVGRAGSRFGHLGMSSPGTGVPFNAYSGTVAAPGDNPVVTLQAVDCPAVYVQAA